MPPQSFSLLLLLLPFCLGGRFYTEEPPVKLLAVQSVATRFPAAASQYRDSVENGHVRFWLSFTMLYEDWIYTTIGWRCWTYWRRGPQWLSWNEAYAESWWMCILHISCQWRSGRWQWFTPKMCFSIHAAAPFLRYVLSWSCCKFLPKICFEVMAKIFDAILERSNKQSPPNF